MLAGYKLHVAVELKAIVVGKGAYTSGFELSVLDFDYFRALGHVAYFSHKNGFGYVEEAAPETAVYECLG